MRIWLALALAMTALAGCTDPAVPVDGADDAGDDPQDDGSPDAGQDSGAGGDAGGATGGNGGGPGANQPPTASLTADVSNGTAPLNVAFTIEGADPDGDNLTWTLAANGTSIANGTSVPAQVAHLFGAGVFDVVLSLTDGTAQATANVTVNATAGVSAPPEDQTFTGTITGSWNPALGYSHAAVEHKYELPSQPATMTVHLSWSRTDGAVDLDVRIYDPEGTQVAAGTNYNDPVQGDDKEEEVVVISDAAALSRLGAWTFAVRSAGSVDADYTLDVTFA